jgi:hypothetical protein
MRLRQLQQRLNYAKSWEVKQQTGYSLRQSVANQLQRRCQPA